MKFELPEIGFFMSWLDMPIGKSFVGEGYNWQVGSCEGVRLLVNKDTGYIEANAAEDFGCYQDFEEEVQFESLEDGDLFIGSKGDLAVKRTDANSKFNCAMLWSGLGREEPNRFVQPVAYKHIQLLEKVGG